jgi:hypothetical protein
MPNLERSCRTLGLLTLLTAFGLTIAVGAAGVTIGLVKLVL